jgi:hypothetical protein
VIANDYYQSRRRFSVRSNPPTEISASTQLLLDEIRKIFHKYEAKWDRRFTVQDAARKASPGVLIPSPSVVDEVKVVADNLSNPLTNPYPIRHPSIHFLYGLSI